MKLSNGTIIQQYKGAMEQGNVRAKAPKSGIIKYQSSINVVKKFYSSKAIKYNSNRTLQ